jgi:hypothetical protein
MKTCLLCGKEMTPLSGDVIQDCEPCNFHAAYDFYTGALIAAWYGNSETTKGFSFDGGKTRQIYIRAVEGTLLIFRDERIA